MDIGIALMGLIVGFLVGITGVGGAAILTPLLIFMGIHPSIAVGTDLLYNAISKLFGTIQHYRQKTIHWAVVKYFAWGSIPGAVIAIGMLHLFDTFFHNEEHVLRSALGIILITVSLVTLWKLFGFFRSNQDHSGTETNGDGGLGTYRSDSADRMGSVEVEPSESKKRGCVVIGFVLGAIVGLTSIGSGSLFAIAILYLFPISSARLVGTDIAHAFLLVSVAGVIHAFSGHVDYVLMVNLLLGSIPGIVTGSMLCTKVPAKPLKLIVALLVLVSGIKLI